MPAPILEAFGSGWYWQPDGERGAFAQPMAMDANRSAVHRNDLPDNGQAESHTLLLVLRRRLRLPEAIEDVRHKGGRNTLAGVHDRQFRVRIDARELHLDFTTRGSEFDCVGQ